MYCQILKHIPMNNNWESMVWCEWYRTQSPETWTHLTQDRGPICDNNCSLLFTQLIFFIFKPLLGYNLHIVKFTHFKCTMQWLVNSSCAVLEHYYLNKIPQTSLQSISISTPTPGKH